MKDALTQHLRDGMPDALIALVGAAGLDLGAGPIASALAGLAVGTAYGLDQAGFGERLIRGGRVCSTAAQLVGGEDVLVRLATTDPARLEITMQVLEAAARTTHEDKIRALGRVVAQGLQDDVADETRFLIAAIGDIEAPHIQVLQTINTDSRDHGVQRAPLTGTIGWTEDLLGELLPGLRLVLPTIIRVLDLHGLIRNIATAGGYGGEPDRWITIGLGLLLLDVLRDPNGAAT